MEQNKISLPYTTWMICKDSLLLAVLYLFIYPAKLVTMPISVLWGILTLSVIARILITIHKDSTYKKARKVIYDIAFIGIAILGAMNLYWTTMPTLFPKVIRLIILGIGCIAVLIEAFMYTTKKTSTNTTFSLLEITAIGILYVSIVVYL
ncbi:MAG: hypothetical protein NC038_06525 [Paludibacter sp.]|nr:hypothetical protein [Bacteroidales bacterium]MCM1069555.1 hypothetical protein [Prevotella sp.]MCM1354201.1 hypothetical protein [Bacteroides sp.]MCM1443060.1 hypothetical protein [Muribaculum sp.]MCM1482275.1 hypothetical protein [Paludibacter sp.]